ncbi:MAG: LCP family protein [Oscillospiraceae bacterium]|nr:LCP family protein [Oscillospiraceae bacterium]
MNNAKVKRILLIVLSVVLALILIALIVGTAYMENLLNLINKNPDDSTMSSSEYEEFMNNQTETVDPTFTGETIDPTDVEWTEGTEAVKHGDHIVNIMLIGQDRRPGEGRTRSDSMILCTINKKTKELTMTSFMRDMYVQISGYQDNRMNACYAFGGMKLLNTCLKENFGVFVDGNIEVDFDGFTEVIDLVGGVDIKLSNSEANHLANQGYNVTAGMNHLDGKTALAHARNRSVGSGDFSRTQRQRAVLSAVLEKCKGLSLTQLNNMLESILPKITTDMSNREIMDCFVEIAPMLGSLKMTTQRIPLDDTYKYASIRGMSVLVPDLEANRQFLREMLTK